MERSKGTGDLSKINDGKNEKLYDEIMYYDIVTKATQFAIDKHKGQVRKNSKGYDYITHPIEVKDYLLFHGIRDTDILSAAVLHDILEDTSATYAEIKEHFGKEVAYIVNEVTDNKTFAKGKRKRLQANTIKDKSFGARMIKIGDKWSNTKDLFIDPPEGWNEDQICGYILWSKRVCQNAMAPGDTPKHLKNAIEKHFAYLEEKMTDLLLEKYYSGSFEPKTEE